MSTSRSRVRVALAHLAYDSLVTLAVLLATPSFLVRAARDSHQLRWARERLLGRLPPGAPGGRPVWVHAVSVGEVKAARPIVAALRERAPSVPLVVTTGTATGYDTARQLFPDTYVCHAPLDIAPVVRQVVQRLDPRLIVLLELEVWPALMRIADQREVPQVIVNGRVTEASWRTYRRFRWWLPEFDRLDLVTAQDETQAERFRSLGVPPERVFVAGNLKHELTAAAPAARVEVLRRELGLLDGRPIFLAGSTHSGEEEAAVEAWRAAGGADTCRLVIVPRHPDRLREIERVLRRLGVEWVLRSQAGPGALPAPLGERVLVVDSMGELETFFGLSDVVFLGGSLVPVGGHNVLEPASAGVPVLVGPQLESCRREAELLRDAGGLLVVEDPAGLGRALAELLRDPRRRADMGSRARAAVADLRGAAAMTLDLLLEKGLLSLDAATE